MTVIPPEYLDENLDKHFKNDVLAALRRIPAERRRAAVAEVDRRTARVEWRTSRGAVPKAMIVSTGVPHGEAWRDYLAENGY